jgi:hypothetical protein
MDLDSMPHSGWDLRVARGQLARGHDSVEQRRDQLKIYAHVNPKILRAGDNLVSR